MIRRPPRSTQGVSSAASDVYKRQVLTSSDLPLIQVFLIDNNLRQDLLEAWKKANVTTKWLPRDFLQFPYLEHVVSISSLVQKTTEENPELEELLPPFPEWEDYIKIQLPSIRGKENEKVPFGSGNQFSDFEQFS
eukprot:TRINITY_DN5876_c0_g1_i2.p1 TRINITY_DN5876_c0_g1~~TRINITY_DN5876_c0_g1_i2.p1  ORF type:complete len:135 (+),score=20.14 TRINITY_DN5876_c0_g1_i2:129-533(+)